MTTARTTPTKRVLARAKRTTPEASPKPPATANWKTRTARMAPMGSMTMPSHLTMEEILRTGLMTRRRGPMTVGPVTTRMAPRREATVQSKWKM